MATLILEDGTRYEGTLFGHKAPVTGEVVFTTGMTGYQETLTDPSYCGQIVCMTYPLMGNVGINDIDSESAGVRMRGFIVSGTVRYAEQLADEEDARPVSGRAGRDRPSGVPIPAR